jgi:hypothetical protein
MEAFLTATENEKKEDQKDPAAVALGRKGGIASGKVRKKRIPAAKRREIARKAINARWAKHRKRQKDGKNRGKKSPDSR